MALTVSILKSSGWHNNNSRFTGPLRCRQWLGVGLVRGAGSEMWLGVGLVRGEGSVLDRMQSSELQRGVGADGAWWARPRGSERDGWDVEGHRWGDSEQTSPHCCY